MCESGLRTTKVKIKTLKASFFMPEILRLQGFLRIFSQCIPAQHNPHQPSCEYICRFDNIYYALLLPFWRQMSSTFIPESASFKILTI